MTRSKAWMLCTALILVGLLLGACGGGATQPPVTVVVQGTPQVIEITSTPGPQVQAGSVQLSGAGATFPFPLYSRWFYEYAFIDPTAKFNYQSIGSGGGIKQITAKTVDFGASDAILNADQLTAAPGIQMLPMVAGAVVPTYNVSELQGKDPIVLDAKSVAGIFLGKITKWNDPALAALNPGVTLPAKDIIVVHRSDGSGTSFIFTDYLSTISDEWKTSVGKGTSVKWPAGLGGKGNEGVAGTVQQNDGAIGYVELAYAVQNKLAIARMLNAAGKTVDASVASTQSALADLGGDMPDTLARSIVNAPGAGSWPIAGYTYLLVYMDQSDCTKGQKLAGFIHWALSDGSKFASDLLYVPLPDSVRSLVLDRVSKITCQGKPLQ